MGLNLNRPENKIGLKPNRPEKIGLKTKRPKNKIGLFKNK